MRTVVSNVFRPANRTIQETTTITQGLPTFSIPVEAIVVEPEPVSVVTEQAYLPSTTMITASPQPDKVIMPFRKKETYTELVEVQKERWITEYREVQVERVAPLVGIPVESVQSAFYPTAYPRSQTVVRQGATIGGWTYSAIRSHLRDSSNHRVPDWELNRMSHAQMVARHDADHTRPMQMAVRRRWFGRWR